MLFALPARYKMTVQCCNMKLILDDYDDYVMFAEK